MITYTTLENVPYETLYQSFMQAFVGFRITKDRKIGIASNSFVKVKALLKQKQVQQYTTTMLRSNSAALSLYLSQGFEIKGEVVNVIKTPHGSREVSEYEIMMKI